MPRKIAERPLFAGPRHTSVLNEDDAEGRDTSFAAAPPERRGGAGLTIFLVVFALLLAGAGGAGFWAWREGYVDLDQMFGRADAAVTETAQATPPAQAPVLETTETPPPTSDDAERAGQYGDHIRPRPSRRTALEGLEVERDRLEPTPEPAVPNASQTVLPEPGGEEVKGEERLPGEDPPPLRRTIRRHRSIRKSWPAASRCCWKRPTMAAPAPCRSPARSNGAKGIDEIGLPTLIGHANIPARNLGVDLTIRKNSDPSLPASHLMEVNFKVSDSFIGGTIAGLPGVLLKNEELVQGTPLVGASARVVGSSFLFALSASAADAPTNIDLLTNRKWMDLAVIYGTGKRAIITLEKDEHGPGAVRQGLRRLEPVGGGQPVGISRQRAGYRPAGSDGWPGPRHRRHGG